MKVNMIDGIPSYEGLPVNSVVVFHGRKDNKHFILVGPIINFEKEINDPVFFTRTMLSATTLYIFEESEMDTRKISYTHLNKGGGGFIVFSDPLSHSKLDTLSWGNRETSNCNGTLFDEVFVPVGFKLKAG